MIEHLTVGMLHTNCYIIKDEATGALAIVDPGAQTEKIMGKLEEIGGKLELILLTHGHFDHVLAAPALQKQTGARLWIHKSDEFFLEPDVARKPGYIREEYVRPHVDGYLEDGQRITLGQTELTVYNTPGHSLGSCVFVMGDVMFSGDTLFHECCGRCDLEGGSYDDMLRSLRRIAEMPGNYRVLPGHDIATTLDYERRANLYMREAMSK